MNRWIRLLLAIVLAVLVPATSQARYLNPDTGRFQTMDSYEGTQTDPRSLHKYLYCRADPANRIDPSGHMDMIQLQAAVTKISGLAAYGGFRTVIFLNRVTIIAWEATTGSTVILGGGGAVALKQGAKMGGVGWPTWQSIGNLFKGETGKIGTYKELAKALQKTGEQANHLNQAAAFPNIPYDEGVASALQGSTAIKNTAHNIYHESLEAFWSLFRKNGQRSGQVPTNAEYDTAMRTALEAAGETVENINALAKLAKESREFFKYFDGPGGLPPTVPERMPLPK